MTKRQPKTAEPPPFPKAEEAALLTLLGAAGALSGRLSAWLREFGLTPPQYNVLRILRGAAPGALACGEVGERLVTPEPDVTRLLDRLVKRGLVAKFRDEEDRRVVRVTITAGGLGLLDEIEPGLGSWLRAEMDCYSRGELTSLVELLERLEGDME